MADAISILGGSAGQGTVVCVFCGSSSGTSPAHLAAARSLAETLHRHLVSLVYGGGTVGLMGEIAKTLVSLSGPNAVHGVIPKALIEYEQSGRGSGDKPESINEKIYGRTTIVSDMHARKHMMAQEVVNGGPGSGFVALPGGYGTMEELMEVITWNQLGIHKRGIVVFNVEGYYDGLLKWLREAVAAGFISEGNSGILVEARDAAGCMRELREYKVAEGRYNLDWESK